MTELGENGVWVLRLGGRSYLCRYLVLVNTSRQPKELAAGMEVRYSFLYIGQTRKIILQFFQSSFIFDWFIGTTKKKKEGIPGMRLGKGSGPLAETTVWDNGLWAVSGTLDQCLAANTHLGYLLACAGITIITTTRHPCQLHRQRPISNN